MRSFVLSLLAVFLALSFCHAQVPSQNPYNGITPAVFNTAGGTYDNPSSYHRYEWSFGELVLVDAMAPNDSSVLLTQGVLQPCTDKGPSAMTVTWESFDYKIFPNPTAGKFELDFFVNTAGRMSLQLMDTKGSVLEKRSYHYDGCCRIEYFDISKYPDGLYFIVADLKPDKPREGDGLIITRRGGLKVIKMKQ